MSVVTTKFQLVMDRIFHKLSLVAPGAALVAMSAPFSLNTCTFAVCCKGHAAYRIFFSSGLPWITLLCKKPRMTIVHIAMSLVLTQAQRNWPNNLRPCCFGISFKKKTKVPAVGHHQRHLDMHRTQKRATSGALAWRSTIRGMPSRIGSHHNQHIGQP